jgi:hypothetical protein
MSVGVLMVRSLVAVIVLSSLAWPAFARAAESTPNYSRIRAALQRPVAPARFGVSGASVSTIRPARLQRVFGAPRDSVWDGLLIGAGIGGGLGYVWARNICGSNDKECSAITNPVGILGGAAIGGAIGAIVDALHR